MDGEAALCDRSDAELAAYPLGIARLDSAATVRFFNAAEERYANRRSEDTIGRNYFTDIAPCRAVKNFQGRFNDFVTSPSERVLTFAFTYPFWFEPKTVKITFLRSGRGDDTILVVTDIRAAAGD